MKKKRIDLTLREKIAICDKETDCPFCAIYGLCFNESFEPTSIVIVKCKKDYINEEIEVGDE